jgi:hypothetical protein
MYFCQVVSEIICNKNRLLVVTPFNFHVYHKTTIKKIKYQNSQLAYDFSFTLKLRSGKTRTHHFTLFANDAGPGYKIADDFISMLESLMQEIGQTPPKRKIKSNRTYSDI